MIISIKSFLGNQLLNAIKNSFAGIYFPVISTEKHLLYDLPIGKITCSCLNSGLTIGIAQLNENAPSVIFEFNGDESETPYKIGFCYDGQYKIDYPGYNISELIKQQENLIITPRNGSSMVISKQISFLYIFISSKFLQEYFNIESKELNLKISKTNKTDFLFAKGKNSAAINLALSDIFNSNYSDGLSKMMLESKSLELLTLFFHQFVVSENNFTNHEKDSILDAHQYILNHLEESITVKSLINLTGLNEHKLQQGFKTIFDNTVLKHIKKLRIQKAYELIVQQNFSISEAGYAVGYSNMSHFATAFRQEHGILPGELKK
ncbi:helix-turn-helix domain-containing protein [Bacteroidota bacterium]